MSEARQGFKTKLVRQASAKEPLPEPPAGVFRTVQYESPAGKLAAYLTPDPHDGKKHPAIIWIVGGDCNSIGEVWEDAPESNDQTAAAYRKAGIVMMFPSLRGGNENPGAKEGFFGEVDDVLAAADYLGKQEFVDPHRIYLGGHSTGGTLVLLVAECSDRFRAVFSFGPVDNVAGYPPQYLPFDTASSREIELPQPHPLAALDQDSGVRVRGLGAGQRGGLAGHGSRFDEPAGPLPHDQGQGPLRDAGPDQPADHGQSASRRRPDDQPGVH